MITLETRVWNEDKLEKNFGFYYHLYSSLYKYKLVYNINIIFYIYRLKFDLSTLRLGINQSLLLVPLNSAHSAHSAHPTERKKVAPPFTKSSLASFPFTNEFKDTNLQYSKKYIVRIDDKFNRIQQNFNKNTTPTRWRRSQKRLRHCRPTPITFPSNSFHQRPQWDLRICELVLIECLEH